MLADWEPRYLLAEYDPDRVDSPRPTPVATRPVDVPTAPPEHRPTTMSTPRFANSAAPWTRESNGRAEVVAVEGDERVALAALGVSRVRLAEVDAGYALATLAWAGASGGAHGRRRGMAIGRFGAWWLLAALGGVGDDWPIPPDDLDALARTLRWFVWDAHEPVAGWQVRLAVARRRRRLGVGVQRDRRGVSTPSEARPIIDRPGPLGVGG